MLKYSDLLYTELKLNPKLEYITFSPDSNI